MAYRRRGKSWEINYYPQGRKGPRKWLTLPAEIQDEAEVQAIEQGLKKARRPERVEVPSGSTVAELFPVYLDWYRLHRKPSSFDNLQWTWDSHLKRIFGHLVAEAVNPQDLEAYARIRKGTKVSNRTVNKELSLFSGFLTWASDRKRGYITPRTFKPELLPCSRPKPIVLSFEEAVKIANAAKPLHRAFILTLYTLGLRFNEARLLRWEDFDLENRTLRTVQKGGSYKVLPVTVLLAETLKKLKPEKKKDGPHLREPPHRAALHGHPEEPEDGNRCRRGRQAGLPAPLPAQRADLRRGQEHQPAGPAGLRRPLRLAGHRVVHPRRSRAPGGHQRPPRPGRRGPAAGCHYGSDE